MKESVRELLVGRIRAWSAWGLEPPVLETAELFLGTGGSSSTSAKPLCPCKLGQRDPGKLAKETEDTQLILNLR